MSSEKLPLPPTIEITKLRLSQTSNLLTVDDPAPAISWAYSVPSSNAWWQHSFLLSLRTRRFSGIANEDTPVQCFQIESGSENINWPNAFPKIISGQIYELTVTAILLNLTPQEIESGPRYSPPTFSASKSDFAEEFSHQLTNDPSRRTITESTVRFESGIVGGLASWRERAPLLHPISTPWNHVDWSKPKAVPIFRNTFELASEPCSAARLYATALGLYKIFVNGKPISDSAMDPGWTEYKLRLYYQAYDITQHLRSGENTITVLVADGWYRGRSGAVGGDQSRRGIWGQETALIALLEIYDVKGNQTQIWTGETSDSGWKCANGPILETEIYDGEKYDSRIDIDKFAPGLWSDVKALKEIWSEEFPLLQGMVPPPVRCTAVHQAKRIIISPEGKKVLDFGQNSAGRIRMKGRAPAGTQITFTHAEALQPDGSPCFAINRSAQATDQYIFNGNDIEEWEPEFTFHGFRYVQVEPWIEGLEVVAKTYGSDLPKGILKFHSSHVELNRLVQNIYWGARSNFLSICTDCPQRDERMGWTGDINVFGPTAMYIFDCETFLTSWLRGVVDGQKLGEIPCPPWVSPNNVKPLESRTPTALWQDVIFTLPWYLYRTYGNTSLLAELYDPMVEYYNEGIPKDATTGLWGPGFQFGDWLDPTAPAEHPDRGATDCMYVADTWLCNVTNTLVSISTVLGRSAEEIENWKATASSLVSHWQSKYIAGGYSGTASDAEEPSPVLSQDTQTAYTLALVFNILPEKLKPDAISRLHYLIEKNNYHLATGFAGTPELLHAICHPLPSPSKSNIESIALAYKVLLGRRDPPSWLYPVTMGATTIWERWDGVLPDGTVNPADMNSLNHYAYGSIGRWIFEHIGGIKMDYCFPGRLKFIFDPIPNLEYGLTSSETVYESPKGRVECIWHYDEEKRDMSIEVALPGNATGEIRFLGKSIKEVSAGRWKIKANVSDADRRTLEARGKEPSAEKAELESGWVLL
ncbi:hypothetical protein H072_6586 [Dactylellina haptotyla CBS 200.50]|uniref:alpha-L-rhamnosidase n=1 Tax=Dactylellina haptotyla (strain CBS 200.50) TaxID=1284197 RepID=S8AEQ9_DACHA|nr:hypothetical protein H072_6586 [Dactylellina haptotyla CBS 200.50]